MARKKPNYYMVEEGRNRFYFTKTEFNRGIKRVKDEEKKAKKAEKKRKGSSKR